MLDITSLIFNDGKTGWISCGSSLIRLGCGGGDDLCSLLFVSLSVLLFWSKEILGRMEVVLMLGNCVGGG